MANSKLTVPNVALYSFRLADVSTRHITTRDKQLILRPDVPKLFAIDPNGHWSMFVISFFPEKERKNELDEFTAFGFSDDFLTIIKLAQSQNMDYLRFDDDGFAHAGLPELAEDA